MVRGGPDMPAAEGHGGPAAVGAPRSGFSAPATVSGGGLRFTTLAEIASGDTARIDLCRITEPDSARGRLVAVKRLHAHLLADRELASMFFDEVWMTASLIHPNVVETVGWGDDDEGPYLAVELVEGVSLARLTKTVFDTGEIFGERMVVYVGSQICRGLAAAHDLRAPGGESLGLVHRDLTPGNVLVGFEGRVKITDFGLAKAKQRITRTVTGLLKGRPQYMAPEQARGDEVDRRADLFSLGVVLFELFAGRRPWSGSTEFEVLSTTQNDPPADLRELRPKIDRELASLVMRLLEKSPDDRFASASEVGIRLDEWLAVHGWSEGNEEALARFIRRNAMRQMRWFERAIKGELPVPRRRAHAGSVPSLPEVRPSRRERAKRAFDDATEVSAAAAEASRLDHPDRQDTPLVLAPAVGGDGGMVDLSTGEEIPTLIQRERPLTPGLPNAPSVRAPPAHAGAASPTPFLIAEEESDGRTTAVKTRGPTPSSASAPIGPATPAFASADGIEDPETETIPVKGPRQQAVRAAIDAARAVLPPPRPPPRPPRQADASSGAPSPAAPSDIPAPPAVVAGTGEPRAWTPALLEEVAQQITHMADVAAEEARVAAAAAALRAAVARTLAEAAHLAAHAARTGATGADVAGAGALMDEAERVAAAARRGDVEVEPPSPPRPYAPRRAEPGHRSEPPPAFPPVTSAAQVGGGHAEREVAYDRASYEPPPFDLGRSGHGAVPTPAARVDQLTALSLRFRPLILGLPPAVAIAIACLALLALLLLVLVVAG